MKSETLYQIWERRAGDGPRNRLMMTALPSLEMARRFATKMEGRDVFIVKETREVVPAAEPIAFADAVSSSRVISAPDAAVQVTQHELSPAAPGLREWNLSDADRAVIRNIQASPLAEGAALPEADHSVIRRT